MHRHNRPGSSHISNMKHSTKAAAQRLARVMAHRPADDEEEEDDDDLYDFNASAPSAGIGLAGGRQTRNRSPVTIRTSVEQPSSVRPALASRPSPTVKSFDHQQPVSSRSPSYLRPSQSVEPSQPSYSSIAARSPRPIDSLPARSPRPIDSLPARSPRPVDSLPARSPRPTDTVPALSPRPIDSIPARSPRPTDSVPARSPRPTDIVAARSPRPTDSDEDELSLYTPTGRSSSYISPVEQPSSARYTSGVRQNLNVKTAPAVPLPAKPAVSPVPAETPPDRGRDKRLSAEFGTFKFKETREQQSSSALQDELDTLQEENDNLLEKLRSAEDKCEEAEARTRQLEKQIASLGDGVSLEARLLSRREAELQKREAALKIVAQTYGGSGVDIATLRREAEDAREEAASATEQLHHVEHEAKALRAMRQRMILTEEEMEEVALKKCWIARYWSLCIRFGIHADLAIARYEYWSSLVSRPVEVILAAGEKAKYENSLINNDFEEREKVLQNQNEVSRKANVESMLLVERGLRELISLKVEDAVAVSLAQMRRPSIEKFNQLDEMKLPIEGQKFSEAFELSPEEAEDVLLKQAWLIYFWRRAKNHGLELDIAEDRLQFWINQENKELNSHDAVDVERGMFELRKLGIETKLWEEPRRTVDPHSTQKTLLEAEM